jgi:hypothetical protein
MKGRTALLVLALAPCVVHAAVDNPVARFVTLAAPDCRSPANFISEADPAPTNATYMRVQHIGDPDTAEHAGQLANAVTWNVGELTGFDARALPGAQRGYRNEGFPVGTSAFQLACDRAGFLINTWQFSHAVALFGEGPSAAIARDLDPPMPIFGDGASLLVEADIRVPWILNQAPPEEAGTAQVSFLLYARDSKSGTVIAQLIGLFENRPPGVGGSGVEGIGSDGLTAFISSPLAPFDALGNPVQFVTTAPESAHMQYVSPWSESRHFRALITYANFATALARLRAGPLPAISAQPSDYRLQVFAVFGEVFPRTGNANNVSIGASISDLTVREIPRLSPMPHPGRRAVQ